MKSVAKYADLLASQNVCNEQFSTRFAIPISHRGILTSSRRGKSCNQSKKLVLTSSVNSWSHLPFVVQQFCNKSLEPREMGQVKPIRSNTHCVRDNMVLRVITSAFTILKLPTAKLSALSYVTPNTAVVVWLSKLVFNNPNLLNWAKHLQPPQ